MALGPRRLRADNFTPQARTPWGGRKIRGHYKAALALPPGDAVVGESWEISVEPSFPSRADDDDALLSEIIAAAPRAWLGAADAAAFGQTPLLVKLLDAAQSLSVQVHPADDDPALQQGESGKPEAWIVLEADEGGGLYLGFRDGVQRRDVDNCIRDGGALDALMTFVPVAPGDAFVIEAGTPHAIGAGVTLVEPQMVAPGKRGLTYRFWDWNRRYDGKPRELHLQRSLAVTSWDAPRGEAFVATCRTTSTRLDAWRERVIDWRWFAVERWRGDGEAAIAGGAMLAVTCVAGSLSFDDVTIAAGQSAVVPACWSGRATGESVDAFIVSRPPRVA